MVHKVYITRRSIKRRFKAYIKQGSRQFVYQEINFLNFKSHENMAAQYQRGHSNTAR